MTTYNNQDIEEKIDKASDNAKKTVAETKDKVTDMGKSAKAKVADIASSTTDKLVDIANETKNKFIDLEDFIESYAKEKPWRLIVWSAIAGIIVSKLYQKNNK